MSILINPNYHEAFSRMGFAYRFKDTEEAIIYFTKAIELSSNDAGTFFERGELHIEIGEYEKGISDIEKAIKISKSYEVYAYYELGEANYKLKSFDKAIKYFTQEINWHDALGISTGGNVFFKRGDSKLKTLDYEGAVADFTLALEDSSSIFNDFEFKDIYFNRGNSKFALEDYNGALSDYNMVISLDPKNGNAVFNQGITMLRLKDFGSACKAFSKAGELGVGEAYKMIQQYCH